MQAKETNEIKDTKDEISNLSFSYDGKKVFFDRCRDKNCQIQVYDLDTGELAEYRSPQNERWTMAKQSYDGKKIVFSVIPVIDGYLKFSQMQIGIMDTDGRNYRKLTTDPMPKIYPTFSHSGKKVLYVKAGRIRKQGRTPASEYDAWEMDIETGLETRLTYFKYFQMSGVSYFPDDEKILYHAFGPLAFPGLDLPDDIKKAMTMIAQEAAKTKTYIVGLLTIKQGDKLPERPYYLFEKGHPAEYPLLSNDGRLFFSRGAGSGKFYLYSNDGNHRFVGTGGSLNSAAISPDGEMLGISAYDLIYIYKTLDGKRKLELYLPCAPRNIKNWPKDLLQEEERLGYKFRMISEKSSRILNK